MTPNPQHLRNCYSHLKLAASLIEDAREITRGKIIEIEKQMTKASGALIALTREFAEIEERDKK